jgi:hypothetical protein
MGMQNARLWNDREIEDRLDIMEHIFVLQRQDKKYVYTPVISIRRFSFLLPDF